MKNVVAQKHPPLKVILMADVMGIGEKGDVVELKQSVAYNELILPKRAVYASPENLEKYASLKKAERTYSSLKAPVLMQMLRTTRLCVAMNAITPWTMENYHIYVSLRKMGIHVPLDSIELPEQSITGPDLDQEGNEFYVTITINKKERVHMRCALRQLCTDVTLKLPFPDNYWEYRGDPMFPEFEEVLQALPEPSNWRDEPRPDIEEM